MAFIIGYHSRSYHETWRLAHTRLLHAGILDDDQDEAVVRSNHDLVLFGADAHKSEVVLHNEETSAL